MTKSQFHDKMTKVIGLNVFSFILPVCYRTVVPKLVCELPLGMLVVSTTFLSFEILEKKMHVSSTVTFFLKATQFTFDYFNPIDFTSQPVNEFLKS